MLLERVSGRQRALWQQRRPARQGRYILAAMHLLPALLVVLARAPVVVPASASLAPIANRNQRLVASLALGLSRLGLGLGLSAGLGLAGGCGRFGHGNTFCSQH